MKMMYGLDLCHIRHSIIIVIIIIIIIIITIVIIIIIISLNMRIIRHVMYLTTILNDNAEMSAVIIMRVEAYWGRSG